MASRMALSRRARAVRLWASQASANCVPMRSAGFNEETDLQHERNLTAADGPHLAFGGAQQVAAAKPDFAAHHAAFKLQQTHDSQRNGAFARPALSREPHNFPGCDLECCIAKNVCTGAIIRGNPHG